MSDESGEYARFCLVCESGECCSGRHLSAATTARSATLTALTLWHGDPGAIASILLGLCKTHRAQFDACPTNQAEIAP